MKINKIIFLICMVAVAVEVSAKGNKREGICSGYIMEAELLKTTSKKICKINDNTRRMPDSDSNKKILDLMSADPDINRVRCIVRMRLGQCKYDTFDPAVQYVEKQEDGTYVLVKSTLTDGILIDLEYTNSIGRVFESLEKDHLFIKGEITLAKLDERQEFAPFPVAKIGKPIDGFGGTRIWKNFSPIRLDQKIVISRYSKGRNKKTTEVVFVIIRIIPSTKWTGNIRDICNKNEKSHILTEELKRKLLKSIEKDEKNKP